MKHLTTLDASFLHFETPETPMHVGSLLTVDLPDGYEGDYYEDVKTHLAHRMHLAPVFEQKLATMPLEFANPVWVDGEADLDYHVRRIVLGRPGDRAQLEDYVGRLHSNLLDRSRPLWEIYVFEGMEPGKAAIYTKFHHSTIDGAAGMAIANAMLDVTSEPRAVPPRDAERQREEAPSAVELASAAVTNMAEQYVKFIKLLPDAARAVVNVALPAFRSDEGDLPQLLPTGFDFAPRVPLSVVITGQRAFAGQSLPLADTKKIAKRLGATINDVVMAVCSTALRTYLAEHNQLPTKSLVAVVPVSLRSEGDTEQNNQFTLTLASLASDVEDPVKRLGAIHASCNAVKHYTGNFKAAWPLDVPFFGAPWLLSGLATIYGRTKLADAVPPIANVLVSNVPGPQFPLYFAGGRLTTYTPLSIPFHGVALNITAQSYNGSLDFGLTACRRAVPDVRRIADLLVDAFEELKALAATREPETAEPQPDPPKSRSRKKDAASADDSAPNGDSAPPDAESKPTRKKPRPKKS